MKTRFVAPLMVLVAMACRPYVIRSATTGAPAQLLGEFDDDYGSSYRITPEAFQQDGRSTYRVVAWHTDSLYLIAQNAPTNSSAPNRWTRIDWLPLDGMPLDGMPLDGMPLDGVPPYRWGFCLSAYDAATRHEAEAVRTAQRSSPRTGCNGFPFTRMRPR